MHLHVTPKMSLSVTSRRALAEIQTATVRAFAK